MKTGRFSSAVKQRGDRRVVKPSLHYLFLEGTHDKAGNKLVLLNVIT